MRIPPTFPTRTMPRRKQAKPRHIQSGEQPPAAARGRPQDVPGDRDGEMSSKRCHTEETKICEKCCAIFFVLTEFLEHMKSCTKNPPVLIMNDSEGTGSPESFCEASLGTFPSNRMDGRTHKDIQAKGCTGSVEKREGKMHAEPVGGMDLKKIEPPLMPAAAGLSYLPKPKVPNTSDAISSLAASFNVIPTILEQLVCLQQQQIQLMEQIRIQNAMMVPNALHPSIAAATDLLKALFADVSQQLSAAVALIREKAGSQSLSLELLGQGKLPHHNTGIAATSSLAAGLSSSFPLKPDGSRDLPASIFQSPKLLLPQSSSSVIFQNPLSAVSPVMDSSKKGKGRPKNSHIKRNPDPVPKHLNNVPTGTVIPYGMSVPLDKSNLIVDGKPLLTTLPSSVATRTPQIFSSLAGIKGSLPGTFSSELQSRPSPESEGGSSSLGVVSHESGMEQSLSSPQATCSVSISHVSGSNKQGSETSKLQQLVENINKSTADPNECLICHRVLSCQSSLKSHYRTHTGEKPFKCKICGRAFSIKGNLKTHYAFHRAKMQHSCPICQKKFTNAVVLQQHIRMHMGGQIPNAPMPEPPCDSTKVDPAVPEKNGDIGRPEEIVESRDTERAMGSQVCPRSSSEPPTLYDAQSESPVTATAFSGVTAREDQMKIVASSLNVQWQSSLKCSDNGSAGSDGMTNDWSLVAGDADHQNSRSHATSESASLQALFPANSQAESVRAKSAAFNKQEHSGQSSIPAAFVRAPPALIKMEVPSDHPLSTGHFIGPPDLSPWVPPLLVPRPRFRHRAKQHICATCGKKASSASALQTHERTHTGEKPFACTLCGKAFATKGSLKVHVETHMRKNSARQGRQLSIDNCMALLGPQEGVGDVPKDMMAALVSINPALWKQEEAVLSTRLAVRSDEISVIQSGTLPGPMAGGLPINSVLASKVDMAEAGTASDMEKAAAAAAAAAADNVPKYQSPHFLEENKIADSQRFERS